MGIKDFDVFKNCSLPQNLKYLIFNFQKYTICFFFKLGQEVNVTMKNYFSLNWE